MHFAMRIKVELKAAESLNVSRTMLVPSSPVSMRYILTVSRVPVLTIGPPAALSLAAFRFFAFAAEQRNEIYHLLLRQMPESGAVVTISEGGSETYTFSIPKEYSGLALASKQAYHEFTSIATKVYTTANFDSDKKSDFDSSKMLKRPFKVKAIVFNKQPFDVHVIPTSRFQLTGGLQPMTDLMRWSLTSIYLRHVEANVELRDALGNAFLASFTFSWGHDVSARLENTKGTKECSMATGHIEKNVRVVLYRMRNETHHAPIRPSMDTRCKFDA